MKRWMMNDTKVRNRKLDEEEFLKERKEVLAMWPTGKEVDLEEAVEFHKKLPDHKNFGKVAARLHREGKTVVFPRAGTPILEQEIELNRTLYESGLPLIPVTSDSYCRLLRFDKAQQGLAESIRSGQPKLNGFPTVVHGVKGTRTVVESTEAALNQRMTNLDTRLLGEIAFAAGLTAGLQDPLINFGCYEKNRHGGTEYPQVPVYLQTHGLLCGAGRHAYGRPRRHDAPFGLSPERVCRGGGRRPP